MVRVPLVLGCVLLARVAAGQEGLTLAAAEDAAVRNEPRIAAAEMRAKAAERRIAESRSGLLPQVNLNATGVRVADAGTSTAAGALTTSSISGRFAYGGTLTQLVTDFGRTSALVASAKDRAGVLRDETTVTHAQVRLEVRQAFYGVLGAEAVLRAAKEAHANRHLMTHQITALAKSELRSTLDVNFAAVLESEAELTVVRAQSLVEQARSRLAAAMGDSQTVVVPLMDVTLPSATAEDVAAQSAQAQQGRADLDAARLGQRAAEEFAKAERRLRYPTLLVLGAAGQIPYRDRTLEGDYAAAGFNLSVPVFNGGLFRARQQEAELEATARTKDVAELSVRLSQQVRDAQSRVTEALRGIDVTERLAAQGREALRLAKARYNAGLGGIVELNEAQLNETSAEINEADARYTYLARRADLDYALGLLN